MKEREGLGSNYSSSLLSCAATCILVKLFTGRRYITSANRHDRVWVVVVVLANTSRHVCVVCMCVARQRGSGVKKVRRRSRRPNCSFLRCVLFRVTGSWVWRRRAAAARPRKSSAGRWQRGASTTSTAVWTADCLRCPCCCCCWGVNRDWTGSACGCHAARRPAVLVAVVVKVQVAVAVAVAVAAVEVGVLV